jgi:hypothetical protein
LKEALFSQSAIRNPQSAISWPTLHAFPFASERWLTCGFRCRSQLRGQRRIRTALPEHLRRIELSMRTEAEIARVPELTADVV